MKNVNYKGFTCLDNEILFDKELSADAKVFLMQIRHILSTKQDSFNPTKSFILKSCGITKSMYDKVMKELKSFIEIVRTRVGSKWEYSYNLLKEIFTPVTKVVKEVVKKVNKAAKKVSNFVAKKSGKKSTFNNYEMRDYDFEQLENELFGVENWD